MVEKVNYLIAACAGRGWDASVNIDPDRILRHHFEELLKTDTSQLAQVTVCQALPINRRGDEATEKFWGVQDLADQLPCKVEFLPLPGGAHSYGLWVQACAHFKQTGEDFDYYVLIEDDYYPAHHDFVEILVNEHKKKLPDGGYLASFTTNHAAVSNGIVDVPSFREAIEEIEEDEDIMSFLYRGSQVNFSLMFRGQMDDFADNYRILFNSFLWEGIHDNIPRVIDIFNPVQYLAADGKLGPRGGKAPLFPHPKRFPSGKAPFATKTRLSNGLTKIGIKKGDCVIVHSSLGSFGILEAGVYTPIEILKEIITEQGMIVMPAFSYGKVPFNKETTLSLVGAIAGTFNLRPEVLRSNHPTHSVAAWGSQAKEFVKGHDTESAFGIDSPFHKLYLMDAKVLFIGVDYNACSVIHLAQELAEVPYLDRSKMVKRINPESEVKVRRAGCSLGFNNIESHLDSSKISTTKVGDSTLTVMPVKLIVDTAVKMLQEDWSSLFCTDPKCFACNEAREMIGD